MKNRVLSLKVIAIALFAPCVPLAGADAVRPSPTPKVELKVENELRVLAEGYEAAFAAFPNGAKYVWVRGGDGVIVLGSVRSIKAYGGVLLIHIDSGPTHAVNAGDVLQVTNEKPKEKPKQSP